MEVEVLDELDVWIKENSDSLKSRYRDYLLDVSTDKEFEIEMAENFDEWCDSEFLREEPVSKKAENIVDFVLSSCDRYSMDPKTYRQSIRTVDKIIKGMM